MTPVTDQRAAELAAIEDFLARNGATRCPPRHAAGGRALRVGGFTARPPKASASEVERTGFHHTSVKPTF